MSTADPRSGGPPCLPSRFAPNGQPTGTPTATRPSRLWLWIVAAFAVQIVVWTAWFILAARHPVEEVPLATKAAH